jgi:hypothetical protein
VNADLSVAPEIAALAVSLRLRTLVQPAAAPAPATPGRSAGHLARLAAAPQGWWDLVRFDPDAPVRIPVPGTENIWLLVLPPGATADCDCAYATLLAGEATESARPLHPGRVRVHGRPGSRPHPLHGAGHGYALSLHGAAASDRSE